MNSENYNQARNIYEKVQRGDLMIGILSMDEVDKMLNTYQELAQQGHAKACFDLGELYYNGEGVVDIDYYKAAEYFKKAGENKYGNNAWLKFLRTAYFHKIEGINKHEFMEILSAIETKDLTGEALLLKGYMLYKGYIFQQNFQDSLNAHIESAKKGNTDAMFELHVYYSQGIGTDKNEVESIKWCKTAAEKGHIRAMYNLGALYAKGSGGLQQNIQNSVSWYKKAADQGHAKAAAQLSVMYFTGDEIEKNMEIAKKYYEMSYDGGFDIDYFFEDLGLQAIPLE